jgi:hypothetical protein
MLQPQTLFTNPQYATNNYDPQSAGWYTTSPSDSNIALRVAYSNLAIAGEIRLNSTTGMSGMTGPAVFQGYDGAAWVNMNPDAGPTGPAGADFTNQVNFNNLQPSPDMSTIVPLGSVFASTYVNVGAAISNVNIRSLQGGNVVINGADVSTMVITQNSNIITLNSQPLPYVWDFTPNNLVSYYKSGGGDTVFKAFGDVSNWVVQSGAIITKGTAVQITRDITTANLVIAPLTYSPSTVINPFLTPYNILGIALENSTGGQTCNVCVKGITTVLCTNSVGTGFIPTAGISAVGLSGLVGCDAGIFCSSMIPMGEYIRAGFFMESGLSIAGAGQYVLFYVDTKLSSG